MFVMDMPDVPPQYAQVMIVQASQAQQSAGKTDRTIGVCSLVQNPMREAAFNEVGPIGAALVYFHNIGELLDVGSGAATVLSQPRYGTLKPNADAPGGYLYLPKPGYFGPDRATFLVEVGGKKVRMLPPQYAQLMIVQASQSQKTPAKADRTIGLCHLIENPPIPPETAVNIISPALSTLTYLERRERLKREVITAEMYNAAKISISQGPAHGKLQNVGSDAYAYVPTPDYYGQDRATVLVEVGGRTAKLIYFFNVMQSVPGGTEGYNPYEDKKLCSKGRYWKISLLNDTGPPWG